MAGPPINRQPNGLLGYLGIKNGGRNPQVLVEELRATWNLEQLYLNASPRYNDVSATIAAGSGSNVHHQVPLGEIWYVHDFSTVVFPRTGDSGQVYLQRFNEDQSISVNMGPTFTFGADEDVSLVGPRGFWMNPQESLGLGRAFVVLGGVPEIGFYSTIRYTALQV